MNVRNYLLIIILGAVLFLPLLGAVHLFDWDEINFAESAREMISTGNYSRVQIDYHPFWEKPPMFFWIQSLSMMLWGVNEYAARFPNALVGILTLCMIFHAGNSWKDERLGWMWVLIYCGSWLPHFYFKSGIIDPLFNLFIFMGIFQFAKIELVMRERRESGVTEAILAGLCIGLAVLTKGPVAILLTILTLLGAYIFNRFQALIRISHLIIFLCVTLAVSAFWFIPETIQHGSWYIQTFIEYQIRLLQTEDSGHGGPFYYHFIVVFLGCFPASFFLLPALRGEYLEDLHTRSAKSWMIALLLVVLIVFSIVKTKIVHYSSLAYFPVTFLAAHYLHKLLFANQVIRLRAFLLVGLGITGLILALALGSLSFVHLWMPELIARIPDPMAVASMRAEVHWSGYEGIAGAVLLLTMLIGILWMASPRSRTFGIIVLFAGNIAVVQLIIYLVVPRIEEYSQRAAIEFYESKASERPVIEVWGFKSYAHLFYGLKAKMSPADSAQAPHYVVCKINRREEISKDTMLRELYEKNGFIFWKRR